jgi:DNA-binding NarL/FixJ family response regulator
MFTSTDLITVGVSATDPLSAIGVRAGLRMHQEFRVLPDGVGEDAEVAVVVADEVNHATVDMIESFHEQGCSRVVVVATHFDDSGVMCAVEAGACGVLRRSEATPERVVDAVVVAARGDGSIPGDLLGRLLDQIRRVQRQVLAPRGLSMSGFTERELDILRLLAEGLDTSEIAGKLAYSERTVKSVIHDVVSRLQLRNRSHAVAFAVRQGLI